ASGVQHPASGNSPPWERACSRKVHFRRRLLANERPAIAGRQSLISSSVEILPTSCRLSFASKPAPTEMDLSRAGSLPQPALPPQPPLFGVGLYVSAFDHFLDLPDHFFESWTQVFEQDTTAEPQR